MLHCHIVNDVIVRPLKEGAVDRADGADTLSGQTTREGHRVSFSNPHIEEPLGVLLLKHTRTGSRWHCSGDSHQLGVLSTEGGETCAEDLRPGGRTARLLACLTRQRVVCGEPV